MLSLYDNQSNQYQRINESLDEEPHTPGIEDEEDDDAVPQSLMIEMRPSRINETGTGTGTGIGIGNESESRGWRGATQRASTFARSLSRDSNRISRSKRTGKTMGLSPKDRAMWKWVNVENMDMFLQEVYSYYVGKGLYCIVLSRLLNLLSFAFVTAFSTFLLGCLDYSKITHGGKLSDIIEPSCLSNLSGIATLFLAMFSAFWLWQVTRFIFDIQRLRDMYNFYTYLLNIPDVDVQTIDWPDIVKRIMAIRENNPMTSNSLRRHTILNHNQRMDAHDIANRIMREENYLIALFNKDILKLSIPFPYFRDKPLLTKTLEWNLSFCLLGFLFDDQGQVRKQFTRDTHRQQLIDQLRRRFVFMGFINMIFAPFIVTYLLLYYFFRYFEEYHKNPSALGSRQFTRLALWKFRDFNELPHLFEQRINLGHSTAMKYIDQFPKEKMTIITKFVAFITGSFAAVLVLASIADPDLFLNFEITKDRNVFFYLGVFGAILAVSRGMLPDEKFVFEPEKIMKQLVEYTHYIPDDWVGKLHSDYVHGEFSKLYQYKLTIFFQELFSVIFTPFVLWYSLSECCPGIIDFLREFTVHVDGIGYVCSFAVFDFKRHGNIRFGAPIQAIDEHFQSKEGKMEKSFLNFKENNPDWVPNNPMTSIFFQSHGKQSKRSNTLSPNLNPTGTSSIISPPPMVVGQSILAPYTEYTPSLVYQENEFNNEPIQSNLGDSYGGTSAPLNNNEGGDETNASGVLGLLNQIYDLNTKGTKGGRGMV